MASASKLGCLIMAAGNSNRFGENKLFAAYRGTSSWRHNTVLLRF